MCFNPSMITLTISLIVFLTFDTAVTNKHEFMNFGLIFTYWTGMKQITNCSAINLHTHHCKPQTNLPFIFYLAYLKTYSIHQNINKPKKQPMIQIKGTTFFAYLIQ